jgi:hypothetical protein
LTEAQLETVQRAIVFSGEKGEDTLAACEQILRDSNVPPTLERWAYLRRMEVYATTSQEDRAVAIGRSWIAANPGNPLVLKVRLKIANLYTYFRSDRFEPTFAEVDAAFSELLSDRYEPSLDVVEARLLYSEALRRQFILAQGEPDRIQYLRRSVEVAEEGRAILESYLSDSVAMADKKVSRYGQQFLDKKVLPRIEYLTTNLDFEEDRVREGPTDDGAENTAEEAVGRIFNETTGLVE